MSNDRLPLHRRLIGAPFRDDHFYHRGSISARLAIGLAIVALGLVNLLNLIGVMNMNDPMRFFWVPVFFAIGITILIERKSAHSRYWAYGWLAAGFIEFAYHMYWISFGIKKLVFPLILLAVGARLVQRAANTPTGTVTDGVNQSFGQTRIFAVLSGSERRTFTQPLKDAEVVSIMSGVKLDLTNAVIESERATLDVTAIMGGIEIYAPSEWSIVSEVTPILGAYIDKRRPTASVATKTLFISGLVLMGGVEVKN
jgi:predicted membrane protein